MRPYLAAALALLPLASFRAIADPPPANREPAARPPAIAALEDDVQGLAAKARPWLVQIACHYKFGKEEDPEFTYANEFSGVILGVEERKVFVVTVGTAVRGAKDIEVVLPDGDDIPAQIVGVDDVTNLALLSFDPGDHKLEAAVLGDSDALKPGSFVLALGNPFGLEGSVSTGVVAGVRRSVGGLVTAYSGLVQVTAPINPGDSGGLLLNSRGEVAGILASTFQRANAGDMEDVLDDFMDGFDWEAFMKKVRKPKDGEALVPKDLKELIETLMEERKKQLLKVRRNDARIASQDLGAEGINFAIPSNLVRQITGLLRLNGRIDRGYLGINVRPVSSALRKHLNLQPGKGVEVLLVVPGSAADAAGLESHDVIVLVDGKPVSDIPSMAEAVGAHKPGESVVLKIRRAQEEMELTATLKSK